MGIKKPLVFEIAPDTYAINEFGLASMYLLAGQERALLIDTGCGVCNLKEVISSLTDKPCTVALTHGHMDHVGGMGCFEEVYLHESDWEMAKAVSCEELRSYAETFGKAGSYQNYDYSIDSIQKIVKFPRFLPLREGSQFDLGGRVVESYEIQGHTQGGVAFLDPKNRIVFSGDCCNTNLLAPDCSVEKTLSGIRKFQCLSDRFDQNFNGHVGYMSSSLCLSQPKQIPDDLIFICESILDGRGQPFPYNFLGHQFMQMKHGSAKLSYNPDNLWEA